MRQTWTIREVARAAGRAPDVASRMARAGMVPGYVNNSRRGIPAELAEPFALALSAGAYSRDFAAMVRDDPESAMVAVEALATLVRASLDRRGSREVAA